MDNWIYRYAYEMWLSYRSTWSTKNWTSFKWLIFALLRCYRYWLAASIVKPSIFAAQSGQMFRKFFLNASILKNTYSFSINWTHINVQEIIYFQLYFQDEIGQIILQFDQLMFQKWWINYHLFCHYVTAQTNVPI